jgi:ubiquinone/menaquinone biosynthesis C-methylase UbiE
MSQKHGDTTGRVLHRAAGYDFLVWLLTRGRDRAFREQLLNLAHLKPGESVLDVGCGTGTLAIAAKRRAGPTAIVHGIDASPAMIARASKKATKAHLNVVFHQGLAEALPFPDGEFDLVLSTVMLHHLPRKIRQQAAVEIRRVLKPEGRVLVVDFGAPRRPRRSLIGHFHRHGRTNIDDVIGLLSAAGLHRVDSGEVGANDLYFVLAAPASGG